MATGVDVVRPEPAERRDHEMEKIRVAQWAIGVTGKLTLEEIEATRNYLMEQSADRK